MGSLYEIALEVAKGIEEQTLSSNSYSKDLLEQGKEVLERSEKD